MALTVEERPVAKRVKGFAEGTSPTVRTGVGSVRIGSRFYPVKVFVVPLLLLGQGRDAFYLLAIVLTVCPAIALTLIDGEGLAAEAHA